LLDAETDPHEVRTRHEPLDIVPLWSTLAATVVGFWRVNWLAGALLLPYLAWVSFAAALNLSIWQMNP
jgi:tryptophan-rich sensory protein